MVSARPTASRRFVQESVANTLGFPAEPPARADNFALMLQRPGFGDLALRWLAAMSRSLDLAVLAEHFDESLLLLGARLGASVQDLVYISQKRRKASRRTNPAATTPAAIAAVSPAALANASAWPSAAHLASPQSAWLWPHELDAAIRGNWLDSLAYMYFNHSLWQGIRRQWTPDAFERKLTALRALRAAVKQGCAECDARGVAGCVAHARRAPGGVTPHLCWTLRQASRRGGGGVSPSSQPLLTTRTQDTRSWSEHFFKRLALRFDASAAMRGTPSAGRGRARVGRGRTGDGLLAADSGMISGNVNWWRCPKTRAVRDQCKRMPSRPGSVAKYSAWFCICSWHERLNA